jgi:hypothetical protein
MRDPHVVAIRYHVGTEGANSFGNPPALTFTTPLGSFELGAGALTLLPASHYSTAAALRTALQPFLRAWEIRSDIQEGIGTIRFTYDSVDLVDRNCPPPGSPLVLEPGRSEVVALSGAAPLTRLGAHTQSHPLALTPQRTLRFSSPDTHVTALVESRSKPWPTSS